MRTSDSQHVRFLLLFSLRGCTFSIERLDVDVTWRLGCDDDN